jgi:hypothetical protein
MTRLAAFSISLLAALAIGAAWPRTGSSFTIGTAAPDIAGVNWINSQPLTIASLKGRVVLVEFWTYG